MYGSDMNAMVCLLEIKYAINSLKLWCDLSVLHCITCNLLCTSIINRIIYFISDVT